MRTLRPARAGTIILMVLLGAAGTAVGGEADTTPAVVTGTMSCTMVKSGTTTQVGRHVRLSDQVEDRVDQMTDPRVTGTFRTTIDQDCAATEEVGGVACVNWGTHVMDGDQGGWDCSFAGTNDPWGPNDGMVFAVCQGTGEHQGLSYLFHHVFGNAQDWGDGTDIRGVIYDGPPPPWGPLPSPTDRPQ